MGKKKAKPLYPKKIYLEPHMDALGFNEFWFEPDDIASMDDGVVLEYQLTAVLRKTSGVTLEPL